MAAESMLNVGGREVQVSNPGKVLYPEAGTTKAEVIAYYAHIAEAMLPHIANRPVTLKRYPEGVEHEPFFEKSCPRFAPEWVQTFGIWSEHRGKAIDYCVINDVATLVWVANLAALEIHVPLATIQDIERPTVIVFDLDPGAPATIVECAEVAVAIRERLKELGLECFAKTSGSKGMQLYIPLNTRDVTFRATKVFARTLAEYMEAELPQLIVSNMRKELRTGKVLIDWSQNDQHKTTVAVYSMRGREQPTVSTPITWREVNRVIRTRDPDDLKFTAGETLARVRKREDLFAEVATLKQRVPAAMAVL